MQAEFMQADQLSNRDFATGVQSRTLARFRRMLVWALVWAAVVPAALNPGLGFHICCCTGKLQLLGGQVLKAQVSGSQVSGSQVSGASNSAASCCCTARTAGCGWLEQTSTCGPHSETQAACPSCRTAQYWSASAILVSSQSQPERSTHGKYGPASLVHWLGTGLSDLSSPGRGYLLAALDLAKFAGRQRRILLCSWLN